MTWLKTTLLSVKVVAENSAFRKANGLSLIKKLFRV